ncbi:hypothetical protein FHS42_005368 [Streptomyces zagrosensis]|uniref:Uncharacterized protein n=1 Tax=Streptomyces zagrosensis TaxID=1042984 RepID=A0A7W9V0M7_9ACTN|nr:hypothetical protein [Streptomyces zagrosensis]
MGASICWPSRRPLRAAEVPAVLDVRERPAQLRLIACASLELLGAMRG